MATHKKGISLCGMATHKDESLLVVWQHTRRRCLLSARTQDSALHQVPKSIETMTFNDANVPSNVEQLRCCYSKQSKLIDSNHRVPAQCGSVHTLWLNVSTRCRLRKLKLMLDGCWCWWFDVNFFTFSLFTIIS